MIEPGERVGDARGKSAAHARAVSRMRQRGSAEGHDQRRGKRNAMARARDSDRNRKRRLMRPDFREARDGLARPGVGDREQEGIALLRGYQRTFSQLELTDLLYQKVATYEGEARALEAAREAVHARPSLLGVYRLVESQMDELSTEGRLDAEVARALIMKHAQRLTVHRCKRCNFRSRAFLASAFDSALISDIRFCSALKITGTIRPSSVATAIPRCTVSK